MQVKLDLAFSLYSSPMCLSEVGYVIAASSWCTCEQKAKKLLLSLVFALVAMETDVADHVSELVVEN